MTFEMIEENGFWNIIS